MRNASAPAAFEVGETIAGTYKIEKLLGQGGMGMVLLASHQRLPGKRVAIKVLHADLSSAEVTARFKREAHIASLLAHPNIVHIEDYNITPDGTPYLVLEYLEGETLAHRLARGPIAVEAALSIVRQVGAALATAHARGVVHRDLKPQNIFLVASEHDGQPHDLAKVLDFGISKMIDSQTVMTEENALLGTPQYMAPEQATGQHGSIDIRTDIFSFGAIVYEMVTGQPAFSGLSVPEIVFKVVYEEPPPLPASVPAPIAEAIRHAMAKQGSDRFASVGDFVEAVTGKRVSVKVPNPGDAFAKTMDSARVPRQDDATLANESAVPTVSAAKSRKLLYAAIAGVAVAGLAVAAYFVLSPSPRHLDREAMKSVAAQLQAGADVEIDGERYHVGVNTKHLRFVKFELGGRAYEAIEQNPGTNSQWAELARQGKHVIQFKDILSGVYVGVIVDGELMSEALYTGAKRE